MALVASIYNATNVVTDSHENNGDDHAGECPLDGVGIKKAKAEGSTNNHHKHDRDENEIGDIADACPSHTHSPALAVGFIF